MLSLSGKLIKLYLFLLALSFCTKLTRETFNQSGLRIRVNCDKQITGTCQQDI